MNRLDPVSAQLLARSLTPKSVGSLRLGTWGVLGLSLVLGIGLGIHQGSNPMDQTARVLAVMHHALFLVDFWVLGLALTRKSEQTLLRVPAKTPLIVGGLHLLIGLWALRLASFDVLYRLELADAVSGIYVVRWGIVLLLGGLVLISLAAAFFEARLVQWVLISEATSVEEKSGGLDQGHEADSKLGSEHVYEAQMILHNLGFDVGGIDGEMKAETQDALKRFQERADLETSGDVTVLTMIELRNRWAGREDPPPGQSVKAISGHVARQMSERVTDWWRKRKG